MNFQLTLGKCLILEAYSKYLRKILEEKENSEEHWLSKIVFVWECKKSRFLKLFFNSGDLNTGRTSTGNTQLLDFD